MKQAYGTDEIDKNIVSNLSSAVTASAEVVKS